MSFKSFDLSHDVASITSAVNEVVSISASLFTTGSGDANVKFYTNIASGTLTLSLGGYYQTIYDSSPTSTSSSALFDLTFGYSTASLFNLPYTTTSSQNEKIKMYRELAGALLGDSNATFTINGVSVNECFFLLVKRGIMKDELKKGSVAVILSGSRLAGGSPLLTGSDSGAAFAFKQTIGGDYAPLFSGSSTTEVGQVWYNAGVIVIPASGTQMPWSILTDFWSGSSGLDDAMNSGTINMCVDGFRAHAKNVAFHNQTNLYSTIYFCRAQNTDFNYSSNPTFVDSNKRIIPTSGSNVLQTRTYITTLGLYDANDNLLAVAKVNKPISKSPDTESVFRVRLDY